MVISLQHTLQEVVTNRVNCKCFAPLVPFTHQVWTCVNTCVSTLKQPNWTLLVFLPNTESDCTTAQIPVFVKDHSDLLFHYSYWVWCTLNNDHIKVRTTVIALISGVPIIQLLNHKVAFMRVKLEARASMITGWNRSGLRLWQLFNKEALRGFPNSLRLKTFVSRCYFMVVLRCITFILNFSYKTYTSVFWWCIYLTLVGFSSLQCCTCWHN